MTISFSNLSVGEKIYEATLYCVVVLLLSSGTIKATSFAAWAPIDVTIASLGALAVLAVGEILRRGASIPSLWPFYTLIGLVLARGLASKPSPYGQEKIWEFVLVSGVAAVALGMTLSSLRRLRLLNLGWLGLALVASVASLQSGVEDLMTGRASLGMEGTGGGLGVAVGVGFLWACHRFLTSSARLFPVVSMAGFGFLVFASGSRGALASVAVGMLVLVVLHRERLLRVVALLAGVVLGGPALLAMAPEEATSRLQLSDPNRSHAWSQAREGFNSSPIVGHGVGSFETVSPLLYPHNIFLEVAFEFGLVGLSILAVFLGVALKRAWEFRNFPDVTMAITIACYWGATAQVALDLRNRLLWISLVALLAVPVALRSNRRVRQAE